MSAELANNIIENLPYYAAAGGALVGAGYDLVTHNNLAAERNGESEAQADAASRLEQSNWLKRTVGVAATAAVFGLAGGAVGAVWAEHRPPTTDKASLVVVADRAGSTAGEQADAITNAINQINGYKNIDGQAVSAWVGVQPADSLPHAAALTPFGKADMHQAVISGVDTLGLDQKKSDTGKNSLVILTADNLGTPSDIVSEDKSLARPVPITIVNFNKNVSPSEVANEKQIAKQTGGQFLVAPSKSDFDKVIDGLTPPKAEPLNDTPAGQKWLVTALTAAGIYGFARKRRHLPMTLNGLSRWFDKDKQVNQGE